MVVVCVCVCVFIIFLNIKREVQDSLLGFYPVMGLQNQGVFTAHDQHVFTLCFVQIQFAHLHTVLTSSDGLQTCHLFLFLFLPAAT